MSRAVGGRAGDAGLLLLLLATAFGLTSLWRAGRHAPGIDFYQFWVVSRAVAHDGAAEIYSARERAGIGQMFYRRALGAPEGSRMLGAARHRQVLETYSTPVLYTAFYLGLPDGYDAAYERFQLASLAALVLGLIGLGRMVGASWTLVLALLLVVAAWFAPLLSDVHVANVNRIQLGLVALFLWTRRGSGGAARDLASGALLALATLFKPNLLPVVALLLLGWIARRRLRTLLAVGSGWVAGTTAGIVASSWFFGGLGCWWDWAEAVRTLPAEVAPIGRGNYALAALARDRLGGDPSALLLGAGLAAAVLAAGRWSWRIPAPARDRERREFLLDYAAVSAGCLIYLLSASLVWLHYYLLAVPAIVFVLRPDPRSGQTPTPRLLAAAAAVTLIALEPLRLVVLEPATEFALVVAGSLVLLVLTLAELRRLALGAVAPSDTPASG